MSYLYKPKGIILHCTASNGNYTLEQLYKDHIKRGFDTIGYHYTIKTTGEILITRPINQIGAHAKGYNDYIGIAYIGGIKNNKPRNTMTDIQIESLGTLLYALMDTYKFNSRNILLHNEIANKECPCFGREFINTILEKGQYPLNPTKMLNDLKMFGLCVHNQ